MNGSEPAAAARTGAPRVTVAVLLLAALCLSAGAAPRRAARPGAAARPTRPLISTTSPDTEFRSVEARLARFIDLLQRDRRSDAARLLSRRVTPAEREALLRRQWLRRDSRDPRDFKRLLFFPDLQIRTQRFAQNAVDLIVVPRPGSKKPPSAYLVVRMRREAGNWRVELHPDKKKA